MRDRDRDWSRTNSCGSGSDTCNSGDMLTGKHADSQIDRQTVVAILRFPVVGGVTSFNSNFRPYL